jgi:hypothetical protein
MTLQKTDGGAARCSLVRAAAVLAGRQGRRLACPQRNFYTTISSYQNHYQIHYLIKDHYVSRYH